MPVTAPWVSSERHLETDHDELFESQEPRVGVRPMALRTHWPLKEVETERVVQVPHWRSWLLLLETELMPLQWPHEQEPHVEGAPR